MCSVRAADRWLRIFSALVLIVGIGFSSRFAVAAQPGCGVDFSKLAPPRTGAIPGFTPFFQSALSLAELERAAEKVPVGTRLKPIAFHNNTIWFAEKLMVDGRPQVVAVKRTNMAGESRNETRMLNEMADAFKKTGLDEYFHVVRPIETGDFHAVYPFFEARDMRELAREATRKMSKEPFVSDAQTGGPLPKGVDPNMDRLWDRFETGIKFAIKNLKKAGWETRRERETSLTTGERYVSTLYISTPFGVEPHEVLGFSIRSSDILVTTDGRFVITDPY